MRKLKERLRNKKGFTLVELIVVIVIILILAAVLIPNVMRYIGQARESAFQSEASGYMTEISGYAAEHYAKYGTDIKITNTSASGQFGDSEAVPSADGTGGKYVLTAYSKKLSNSSGGVHVYGAASPSPTFAPGSSAPAYGIIRVTIDKGAVLAFSYCDGTYFVNWSQSKGWDNVQKKS